MKFCVSKGQALEWTFLGANLPRWTKRPYTFVAWGISDITKRNEFYFSNSEYDFIIFSENMIELYIKKQLWNFTLEKM